MSLLNFTDKKCQVGVLKTKIPSFKKQTCQQTLDSLPQGTQFQNHKFSRNPHRDINIWTYGDSDPTNYAVNARWRKTRKQSLSERIHLEVLSFMQLAMNVFKPSFLREQRKKNVTQIEMIETEREGRKNH